MAACPRCGTETTEGAKFCLECGTRLSSPRGARGSERKVVTALFCDLVGSTARAEGADPEDVHATLTPYHARVKDQIVRLEGTVEKFVGDAVMAVFGAPKTHEDDPERAIRAALAILDSVEALNSELDDHLSVRIGINTGEVLVSIDADPLAGEAMVAGDAVNTAARLQTAAPAGATVVGEPTYRATRDLFDFEELEPASLPGKTGLVTMWRVVAPVSRFGVDAPTDVTGPLIGRDLELRLLTDTFERCLRDRSLQLVTISGEPGIGKSRLVAELGRVVDQRPELVAWRQGRCLPYGDGITFWALGEIVKAHAGILESERAEVVEAKLLRVLPPEDRDKAWLAERLAPLVGLRSASSGEQVESFTAWRHFLEWIAESGPAVFIVEDLHWADQALLEFLEHMANYTQDVAILLVCTTRPELYETRPGWGGGTRNATTIKLTPLSHEDATRLFLRHVESAVIPAALQVSLLERAEGNPLFVEEIVRLLRDEGLFVREGGALSLKDGVDVPLPDTIKALIAARLDTLDPERKRLLQDASVVGNVFWSGAVAAISGRAKIGVEDALRELARGEFVRPVRTSSFQGETEFAFLHVLVRDVAYAQIPRADRAVRHQRAAEWIEQASERVQDNAEILAHHYLSAVKLRRASGSAQGNSDLEAAAARFLILAAERVLELDTAKAEALYATALDILPEGDPQRPVARAGWARAIKQQGRVDEAALALEEASSSLVDLGDRSGAAVAKIALASALWARADPRSREVVAEAVALLESEPPGPEHVAAYAELARHEAVAGRASEAIAAADVALDLAARLRLEPPAKALGYRGTARQSSGDIGGIEDLRSALSLAIEQGLGGDAATIYNNLALLTWWIEGPRGTLDIYREGIDFAERRGIVESVQYMEVTRTGALGCVGHWDQVREVADRLTQSFEKGGFVKALVGLRAFLAHAMLLRGEASSALPLAAWAADVGTRSRSSPDLLVAALPTEALARFQTGDRSGATRALRAVEGSPEFRTAVLLWERLPQMARTAIALGEVALAERIVAFAGDPPFPYPETCLMAARAAILEERGELEQACELYGGAADRYDGWGVLPEQGYALLGGGRSLLSLGNEKDGRERLAQACSIFTRLGAQPALDELDSVLEERREESRGPTG